MPSFWKRGTLAALVAGSLAGTSLFAQQSNTPCLPRDCPATQIPPEAWQHPGQPCPWEPGKVTPADPKDPMTPSDPMMPQDPMDPMTPMDPMNPMDPMPPIDAPPVDVPPDANLAFNAAEAGIGSPDIAFNGSPNMMGDLLRAYRGITFSYLQAGDFSVANTSGAVNFRNSKVAENNNAMPRNRFSFRYNYFKEALQVDGLINSPTLGPRIRQAGPGVSTQFPQGTPIRQFNEVQPASKSYNVHLYTLGVERTFFDDLASIEVRVPFARTINSDLNLVSGDLVFDDPNIVPLVQPTPGRTLGDADTELQDMNVILKAVMMRDPGQSWVVSGGVGITIPTGDDLNARVVDYSNDVAGDPNDFIFLRPMNQFAFDQRTRQFRIKNQTWGVAPFLAAAATPSNRTFINAFAQIDVPVNSSDWSFRETDIDLEVLAEIPTQDPVQFDRSLSGEIEDQMLLQLDVGAGYWFYRNPCQKHIKGVAGLAELHYTGTLEDADIVVVNETQIRTVDANGLVGPLPPPRLGNIANRIDILNATIGGHILVGPNASVSAAYVAPLRDEFDRTFDGELNVQLNLYR